MDIFNRIDVFNNYKDVSNERDLENTAFEKRQDLENTAFEKSRAKTQNLENPARKSAFENDDNDDNDRQVIDVNSVSNSNIDSDSDIVIKEGTVGIEGTDIKEIIDVNNDETYTGGIIYDILHIFDDIYVYGRTLIENNYFNLSENDEFNLVYPNIYIGNYSTSTNYNLLKDLGITHIVSVIPSFNPPFLDKFKYIHIQAYDDESQDIKHYFEISNEFISKCLNEGGKVLIHCMVGRSRSVSICMAFLIHIIQGNFHKKSLNLENYNDDIYNSVEYNKFIKNNNKRHTNTNTNHNDYENINRLEHIKPNLNNKEQTYIVYKKEVMLNEIDDLINTYTILKKEIYIKKKCNSDSDSDNSNNNNNNNNNDETYKTINELNKIIKTMKEQSGKHFIIQLLKYIKKYRSCANPNPYFITQLSESIF